MASSRPARRLLETMRSRKSSSVAIHVDSGCALLKGATQDASPALLRVRVVLDLLEPLSVRSILLRFEGRASTPHAAGESGAAYDICNEEWSLLSSTSPMMPGSHTFPFEIFVGGSLPASTSASTSTDLSVFYTLRTIVVCAEKRRSPLHAAAPVQLMRSFPSDSLEYQQSLEHEDSLCGQLMYSLSIPHKTWAAGETLSAVFKAAVIAKGASIRHVRTFITEDRCTLTGSGEWLQQTTIVASKIEPVHQLESGKGALGRMLRSNSSKSLRRQLSTTFERTQTPVNPPHRDTCIVLSVPIPCKTAPSSSIEPVIVNHHVCWTLCIVSALGVTSEVNCRLPLHILDHRLLSETVAATFNARYQTLGVAANQDELGAERHGHTPPRYSAHVQDLVYSNNRVAGGAQTPLYEETAYFGGLPPLGLLRQLPEYAA